MGEEECIVRFIRYEGIGRAISGAIGGGEDAVAVIEGDAGSAVSVAGPGIVRTIDRDIAVDVAG